MLEIESCGFCPENRIVINHILPIYGDLEVTRWALD